MIKWNWNIKLIAVLSFAFIYECFSNFLTLLSQDWFNTTAINNGFQMQCYTKDDFQFFQTGKEQYQLPDQRSNWLENQLVLSIIYLIIPYLELVVHYVLNKKLKTVLMFAVFHVTDLCAFKKKGIASKTFTKNETFHLIY